MSDTQYNIKCLLNISVTNIVFALPFLAINQWGKKTWFVTYSMDLNLGYYDVL